MPDELSTTPVASVEAPDAESVSGSVRRVVPADHFWFSLLLPGAGQIAQRRYLAGAIQAITVGTYLLGASAVGGGRAMWLALAWNVWSAIDAYWHAGER